MTHPNYTQYCYSNAVFSTQAISNFINQSDNFTDSYENADKYFLNASKSLSETNLYPQTGQLKGTMTDRSIFQNLTAYDKDFNEDTYDWTYRGAYSGCCANNGWKISLDTIPFDSKINTKTFNPTFPKLNIFPNPFRNYVTVESEITGILNIYSQEGKKMFTAPIQPGHQLIELDQLLPGIYIVSIRSENGTLQRNIIK